LDYTLVVAKGNTVKSKKEKRGSVVTRPTVPYWEDPVYHYLSRRHRSAVATGDGSEVVRFDGLMQELVNRTMPDEVYWQPSRFAPECHQGSGDTSAEGEKGNNYAPASKPEKEAGAVS
jgi:hypothetical protein